MRLFIAINFSQPFKQTLLEAMDTLHKKGIRGNFTREENLHLTLAFIGESERINDLSKILDSLQHEHFDISIGKGGQFGNLLWAGLDKSNALSAIAADIRKKLLDARFDIDTKPFNPHITLVREASERTVVQINPCSMTVSRISLMRSDRINGKLVYREVFGKSLL